LTTTIPSHYDPYPRQAAAHATQAYVSARPAEFVQAADDMPPGGGSRGIRLDGLAVAALIIVAFLAIQSVLDRDDSSEQAEVSTMESQSAPQTDASDENRGSSATEIESAPEGDAAPPLPPVEAFDPTVIAYPYDDYWVTQGPHGFSYGHMAIDIAAGKGAPVESPIHGFVTANYVDQYGNTTLVIENEIFRVTLLHGDFSVQVDQEVRLREVVGAEGNNGYTTDMQGRSCRNRDCGYHSHLNVFNKVIQANVNPLDVLQ